MDRKKLTIPVGGDESVSAILTLPPDKKKTLSTGVITAHGAGNDMENDLVVAFTDGVAGAGYPTLRFNFPYKEKGLKAPDRQNKLEDTWAAVCRYFQENAEIRINRIIAAGKSMGGRVASQMAAEKRLPVEGLIFLGYPLHPADDQTKLRDAHLSRIALPMLFFAGTRDTLCNLTKLQNVLNKISAPWQLEIIEGGDHSFYVPKSMNLAKSDVFDHVVQTGIKWLEKTFIQNN
ncbi:MAG: dienelactone hydrolase family protein [Deltaproteobacteria bacterium]|nr:dienelactone hydrolase family protein [Deltaproteobacteria bacterium]